MPQNPAIHGENATPLANLRPMRRANRFGAITGLCTLGCFDHGRRQRIWPQTIQIFTLQYALDRRTRL